MTIDLFGDYILRLQLFRHELQITWMDALLRAPWLGEIYIGPDMGKGRGLWRGAAIVWDRP